MTLLVRREAFLLQNIDQLVPTDVKVELIHRLQLAGLRSIECTSFVPKKWVPQVRLHILVDCGTLMRIACVRGAAQRSCSLALQMGDNKEVFAGVAKIRQPGVSYAALTPNMKGFEAAVEAGADEVGVFAAASELFSQRNINCSIEESFDRLRPVCEAAIREDIPVRGCGTGLLVEARVAYFVVA